jgi:hypothetical protein
MLQIPGLIVERVIPDDVLAGVMTGRYVVHGGVIRCAPGTTCAGQIVRHLLPVGDLDIFSLSGRLDELARGTSQILKMATATMTLSGLNLVVSAVGFAALNRKLDSIEGRLSQIQADVKEIKELLQQTERARIRAAIRELQRVEGIEDVEHRRAILHERLSKPMSQEVEADQATAESMQPLVDVIASFIPDDEAAHLVLPSEGAFHHPAEAPQLLGGLDARTRDAALDPSPPERPLVLARAVRLVCMQLLRSLPGSAHWAGDRRNPIDELLQKRGLIHIGSRDHLGERNAVLLRDHMARRALLASVRRVRSGLGPPLFAGTLAASMAALDQSILSASRSRVSNSTCSASHTPASLQSRKRRQQVMPLPQPISCGSISQGMPLFRTKMIPVKQARSGTRGRPPFGFGGSGGSSGSMISHNSSGTSGAAICPLLLKPSSCTASARSGHRF